MPEPTLENPFRSYAALIEYAGYDRAIRVGTNCSAITPFEEGGEVRVALYDTVITRMTPSEIAFNTGGAVTGTTVRYMNQTSPDNVLLRRRTIDDVQVVQVHADGSTLGTFTEKCVLEVAEDGTILRMIADQDTLI